MAIVDAGDLEGETAVFVTLPDAIVVEEGGPGFDPARLARALDLDPPYRAEAIRRNEREWAVGACRIEVAELGLGGDAVEMVWDGYERSVRVDGEPTLAALPQLEAIGSGRFAAWVLRARRLHGRSWEIELEPL